MKQKIQCTLLKRLTLGLLVCAFAFIPAQAQKTTPHHTHEQRSEVKTEVQYSCPMHPDVTAKKPGRCPKCGMDLRVHHDETEVEAPGSNVQSAKTTETVQPSKMNIPDIELLDQNGNKIHFYSDLVKG